MTAVVVHVAVLALFPPLLAGVLLPMLQGPQPACELPAHEPRLSIVPPFCLCVAVFVLGVFVPPPLSEVLHRAAVLLGGGRG